MEENDGRGFGAIRKPDWYKVMQPIAPKLPQPITPNSDYLNLEMLRM